jgi:uncharacterized membrane protein (DUF373 family)
MYQQEHQQFQSEYLTPQVASTKWKFLSMFGITSVIFDITVVSLLDLFCAVVSQNQMERRSNRNIVEIAIRFILSCSKPKASRKKSKWK